LFFSYDGSLVEKTPHNAVRIGYLEKLNSFNKYIYIVRNGLDVVGSIQHRSIKNSYKIAGRENYNQWWGVDNSKWNAIKRDRKKYGYELMEIDEIESDKEKAAVEWILTNLEIEKWMNKINDKIHVIKYEDFISDFENEMNDLLSFLSLQVFSDWIEQKSKLIREPKKRTNELKLPKNLASEFNRLQKKYNYKDFSGVK